METGKEKKSVSGNSKVAIGNEVKTTVTPDLSKELRKLAGKYEETDYRHWVPMIVAARLGKMEELIAEFAPNSNILDSVVEFGRTTDWTAGKKSIIRKAASTVGAASLQVIASTIAQKMKDPDKKKKK